MSKIKDRYWDFINSEDYESYLHSNTPTTHQIEPYEVFTTNQYPRSELLRKRLKTRFKQDDKKVRNPS